MPEGKQKEAVVTEQSRVEDVSHVVYVSTNIGEQCEHCTESVGLERFAESVNHYIDAHGYKVLHVGAETSRDDNGNPWQSTVAVLGAALAVEPSITHLD